MCLWFTACLLGELAVIPLYLISVERLALEKKYGKARGSRVGDALGLISGWGLFLFWIGLWVSPQPRFAVPIPQTHLVELPILGVPCTLFQAAVAIPLLLLGAWLGISGVRETSLRVAETHRPTKIVTSGVYSIVRHPQYLGALVAHGAISLLLSALFSLAITPVMVGIVWAIAKKEEVELLREFGEDYKGYMEKVPMLVPAL